MMDAIIGWSLRNRAAVLALAVALLVAGGWITLKMPVDVFPDLTAPTVTVITEAHGMAPTEVETQITFPIETAVNGAPGVRRVRSSTAVGLSVVWVEFDWGVDIYSARQIVSEKVTLVSADLPPGVSRPTLAPISSVMGEILFIALTSDRHAPMEIRAAADATLRRRLLSVPGVSQVTPIGGAEKKYQVFLSPSRLAAHGVSLEQAIRSLEAGNGNVSAGFINERGSEYLVTGYGRVRTLEDIADTVVDRRNGSSIRIADLGRVTIGEAPKRGEGSAGGRRAVILGIQKQPGANTLVVTREIDRVLAELQSKVPDGMRIDGRAMRQADFIEVAVRNVEHALRDGAILVIFIVVLFLSDLRFTPIRLAAIPVVLGALILALRYGGAPLDWTLLAALAVFSGIVCLASLRAPMITLTAIPLSLLASVIVLSLFGAGINTMTLGGMVIAIGALVDDAIIDVENVFRRLRENHRLPPDRRRPALEVVYSASVEIRSSIVFATFIIILVFVPIFFLPGVEGRLLQPLGLAYVVALFASLVVAMTVTPALCHLFLPGSKAVLQGHEPRIVSWLKTGYGRALNPVLRHPWAVTAPAVALLAAAVILPFTPAIGRSFLPEFNEGALTISAVTLPGTALPESDRLGRAVETAILAHPEVRSVARRTGRAELDEHAQGVEASELDVAFELKGRTRDEFLEALRNDLSQIPGMNITIGQPISHRIDHMLSGTRANIAVKIFGDDLYRLRALARKAEEEMRQVPGAVDVSSEAQADIPILKVRMDRHALARYGLRIEDVNRSLEAVVQGVAVSRILEGRQAYDLVVRIASDDGSDTGAIRDLPLEGEGGARIPMKAVAAIDKDSGPNAVSRENVERKIVVTCNVAGRDVISVVEDCRRRVDPLVNAEKGYRVEYGGQFEAAEDAGIRLAILGAGVIVGIALLLRIAFGSGRDAAFVMINLPLALIGGMAGVLVSGSVISVASIIGFITVFGIAARNGIMLVSHIRHLQEHEGETDLRQAVFRGSLERLAPILMTALAAGLALIPLAVGGGKPGNEIQTPMAVVVLFGLMSSTLLNMFVVPALYLRFGKPVAKTAEVAQ